MMKLILLTLFLTTLLNAQYLRTIRLGAFTSQDRAQVELEKVNVFVSNHTNIKDLQKVWDFKFTVKKLGKYYVTLATPMRDKDVLQEVIDTLRLSYPDAYVRRLGSASEFIRKENRSIMQDIISKEKKIEVLKVVEKIQDKSISTVTIKAKEKIKEKNTQSLNIYQFLFFLTLFFLAIVSALLYRYKKKSISCKDKEMQTNEIFTKIDREIKHKDSFLTHAKTSVATIHNFTNLLLEFDLTIIQKDYVQRIRSSSEHLLNTLNNTLDITKLKNESLAIENMKFDLNEMLRHVSSIISLEAKNNNTTFELNIEDDVPAFIFGDQTHIRQVLINLLGNSVKFTHNGKISLNIKTLYNYTHAITLGFIIKDTGIGMSAEQVDDILDLNTEILKNETVGLGLFVAKQLIEMMQGEIKIYSTQDLGTTFTFTLKFNVLR